MLIFIMFLQAFEVLKIKAKLTWAVFFKGFYIVLDYDGTMVRFYYGVNKKEKHLSAMLPCLDSEVYEYSKYNNLYKNVYSFKVVKYILSLIPREKIFVLTRSEKTVMANKTTAATEYFKLDSIHVLHVQDSSKKTEVLAKLLDNFNYDNKKSLTELDCSDYIYNELSAEKTIVTFIPSKNERSIICRLINWISKNKTKRIVFIEDSHPAALKAEETLRGKVYSYLASSLLV